MDGSYDEVFAAPGQPREHAVALAAALADLGPDALTDAGRMRDSIFMQQGITFDAAGVGGDGVPDGPVRDRPFPLDLVPRIIPAARVARHQARPRAADPRAQRVRRRRLPRARDRPRRHRAVGADRLPLGVRPRRARHPAARRRLLPRVRLRPRPRRRRQLEGARGQRPHAERDLLRAREPRRDDAAAARAVRVLPRPARRPLPRAAAHGADRGRPDERRGGGDRRRLDPGPVQLRLLRARLPRAPDGRRARRGVGPRGARRRVLHPHHERAPARPRDLPPDRRRLHGPARVPPRLAARRPGADARLPRRHGRDRQRGRHRRRGRQGGLPPRPGHDPLLPRRGADPPERADLPARRPGAARPGARAARPARRQAGRPVRRQGRVHRPRRERRADRAPGRGGAAPPRALDRAGARASSRPARPPRPTAGSSAATSTCARSRSSARTSTSSPAGSRAWRCGRAR